MCPLAIRNKWDLTVEIYGQFSVYQAESVVHIKLCGLEAISCLCILFHCI